MVDLLQFWTDLSSPRLYGGIFRYPSALMERLMADINPGINISHCITWEQVINNTYGWLNARALFDRSQQEEFKRQQKHHAILNDLEKATEQLYDHSIEAEVQDNERRAKAKAKARVPAGMQEKAGTGQSNRNHDVLDQRHPVPTLGSPASLQDSWPGCSTTVCYTREMDAAGHDAKLNKELGLDKVFDPLALGNTLPTLEPGTPPAYGEDTTTIPPICLPTSGGSGDSGVRGLASGMASPITKHDNWLLDGLPPGLPMEVGISQAPGSGRGSSHKTPMSLGSPMMPGVGCTGVLK